MSTKARTMSKVGALALLACMVCMLMAVVAPQTAHADGAATAVEKVGKGVYSLNIYSGYQETQTYTYKKADVTGDKKKDKIQTVIKSKATEGEDGQGGWTPQSCTLKVNGKKVKKINVSSKSFTEVYIVTMKDSRSYLWFSTFSYVKGKKSNDVIYKVKGKKLKKVFDFSKIVNNKILIPYGLGLKATGATGEFEGNDMEPMKVKGSTLCVRAELNTKALGYMTPAKTSSCLKLTYSKGKFKVSTKAVAVEATLNYIEDGGKQIISDELNASTTIKTVKKIGSKKAGVTIQKNDILRVNKFAIVKKALYVQIADYNGKTGWVKLGKKKLVNDRANNSGAYGN